MEDLTKGLDERLGDRMEAYQELVLTQHKVAECILAMEDMSARKNENKFLSKSIKEILPDFYRLMDGIQFNLVEIMLDGDPRYYGEEEE